MPSSTGRWTIVVVALVAATAATLSLMGRVPICRCGNVKPWHGVLWVAGRRWPLGARLGLAVAVEGGWEIVENTDTVINRYREATISLDYYGDSIVNSVSDVVAMIAGFGLAAILPVWSVVAAALAMEGGVGLVIRDNLTLNVLMLLYPLDAVRRWQAGG
jgi:hypothetical protein